MSRELVSVVMPTYKLQASFLPDALDSVLSQSYPSLEVEVVTDGSEEISRAVESFRRDPRVKTCIEKGRGYIAALNQGIGLSRGVYVGFCDSDDILNKDHLKVLVETAERYPDAGLIFDNMQYFGELEEARRQAGNGTSEAEAHLLISRERAKDLAKRTVSVQDVLADNLVSGPAFMVPKRVFDQVGSFDADAFLMNDLHLFYRIGAFYPIRFVDYVGVRKRVHAANLTTVHRHYECGVRCLENIRKRYPEVYHRIGARYFNKKLGNKYYRLGMYYERGGEKDKAREMYKKAMCSRKFSFRHHWNYLRLSLLQ